LAKAIDDIAGQNGFDEQIFAQIGNSSYHPQNFEAVPLLEKKMFDKHVLGASCIISHAGIGTITLALEHKKPLLVMPRLKKYGEVVNDHQVAIARKFEEFGHILVAYQEDDLQYKIEQLKSFVPNLRQAQPEAVTDRIARFLTLLSEERK
jgi:UDP-N-acetylglucosamine transferase subunit ALG13